MKRLTDRKTAAALKCNAEGLRAKGFDIPIGDQRYIKLAEYEDAEERREQKKCTCKNCVYHTFAGIYLICEKHRVSMLYEASCNDFYPETINIIKEENSANTCVCCGAVIPEGRQVCLKCERGEK